MALENRAVCNGKFIAELRDPIKMHAELKLHFTITVQELRETRLGFDKIPDFRRKTGKVLFLKNMLSNRNLKARMAIEI